MTYAGPIELPSPGASSGRPSISSYDLGYEYSQEHYIALQCMLEDADEVHATFAPVLQMEEVAS